VKFRAILQVEARLRDRGSVKIPAETAMGKAFEGEKKLSSAKEHRRRDPA
jgi:hypothetical protein